jgi:hypothetical protein
VLLDKISSVVSKPTSAISRSGFWQWLWWYKRKQQPFGGFKSHLQLFNKSRAIEGVFHLLTFRVIPVPGLPKMCWETSSSSSTYQLTTLQLHARPPRKNFIIRPLILLILPDPPYFDL